MRQDRDQARQDIEDLEAAIDHLTSDVATSKQALYQAKVGALGGATGRPQ